MARRKVLIDVGPLRRSKDFRYLFFGEMVSLIGSGLTAVAVPFQLYSLTGSSLQVGLASLAQLLPLIACSFVGGAIAGWVAHVKRPGRAVVIAVLVWGASITAFGLVRSLLVGLLCLAIAGWADVVSAIFHNSILQLRVPDQLRGRMNAIQTAVVAGGPRLGDFESGLVATVVSPTFSVVSGGIASMVVAAVMTITMPVFWRLRLTPGEPNRAGSSEASSGTEPGFGQPGVIDPLSGPGDGLTGL